MRSPLRFFATISALVFLSLMAQKTTAQTVVTVTNQTGNLVATFTDGNAGWFNSTATRLGFYAKESGLKQAVAWQALNTTGSGTGGTSRSLQVGDEFRITSRITRAFGEVGISLNATQSTGTWANRRSNSRLYINTDNNGSWYVGGLSGGATSSFGYNPSENTYRNYEFRVFITSATTGYVELYVDGTFHATANNLTFGGTSGQNINGFAMYGSDMWDGSSNDDGFFEGTTVRNNGSVNLGYSLASGTFTPGVVSDGLAANSTTATSANSVNIGGNSGTSVILNQNNTYTGATLS